MCTKKRLRSEHLDIFKAMNKGDLWVYKSNLGNFDTLEVKDIDRGSFTNCNRFELGEFQYQSSGVIMELSAGSYSKSYKMDHQVRIDFSFDKYLSEEIQEYYDVFDLSSSNKNVITDTLLDSQNDSVPVTSFILKKNAGMRSLGGNRIKAFYWSNKKGLMRYVHKGGETFDLISN